MQQEVYTENNGAPPASVNDRHLACVMLLDNSASMHGTRVDRLNEALREFKQQCAADDALRRGLDIAVVSFNSYVQVLQEFTPVTEMIIPTLEADGQTHMGLALNTAMDMLESRKSQYREIGVPYHRPWIFMISDGVPNDDWEPVRDRLLEMQAQNKLELWAVGVPGYEREVLQSLTKRVIELDKNLQFAPLFEWLSNSLSKKSQSAPGDNAKYDNLPAGSQVVPVDWG